MPQSTVTLTSGGVLPNVVMPADSVEPMDCGLDSIGGMSNEVYLPASDPIPASTSTGVTRFT